MIESLLEKCDILLLGGGMIFTFYKAQGISVGSSLVEEDKLDLATSLLSKAKSKGVSLLLPTDVVIADKFAPDANSKVCFVFEIIYGLVPVNFYLLFGFSKFNCCMLWFTCNILMHLFLRMLRSPQDLLSGKPLWFLSRLLCLM